jgi:hypothetical protein
LRRVTANQINHVLEQLDEIVRLPDPTADDHDSRTASLSSAFAIIARAARVDPDKAGVDLDASIATLPPSRRSSTGAGSKPRSSAISRSEYGVMSRLPRQLIIEHLTPTEISRRRSIRTAVELRRTREGV